MRRFRLVFPLALLLATPAIAQRGGDLLAQIEYAFQVEDLNRLESLAQLLGSKAENDAGAHRFELAHVHYRFGSLLMTGDAHRAETMFANCVDEIKPLVDADPPSVESLVLQSDCYTGLAELQRVQGVLWRARAGDRLRAADALAPRNPRVMYAKANADLSRAKPRTPAYRAASEELESAARAFEKASLEGENESGWGDAEAYLALGRNLEARSDYLGARNWIEKALIASPDYKAAQRQRAALRPP